MSQGPLVPSYRPGLKPILYSSGFSFLEGPSFDNEGNLFVCEGRSGFVWKIRPDRTTSRFACTGGAPIGSKFHSNGHLFVTDCFKHAILDVSPQGMASVYVDRYDDAEFGCPNDLVFDEAGNLYFTDSGSWSPEPGSRSGRVFRVTSNRDLSIVATGLAFANGIALSEDESRLFVAETITKRILSIDLQKKGRPEMLAQMHGGVGPDGMALGTDGNLYVAHVGKGVIAVIDPEGRTVAEVPAGGMDPTNLAFNGTSLFVTEAETGSVQRLDIGVRGIPLFGQRIRTSDG